MKLSVGFQRLERARVSINASKAEIGSITSRKGPRPSPIEVELLDRGSLILSGEELDELLEFPAGLAAIGNTQITLHIFQPFVSLEDLLEIPAPAPKFHVADCKTLERMRKQGRFNRYVSTAKSTELFRVEPWDHETRTRGEEIQSHLAPCINCLKFLNYDGYEEKLRSEQKTFVRTFDIEKFFENYKPIFRCLPLYTPENFPEGNYTSDWALISEAVRRKARWKCKSCEVDLSQHRGLLHLHHIDGNRGNNRSRNLMPLCCLCHKEQPLHGGMYIKDSEKTIIQSLRAK